MSTRLLINVTSEYEPPQLSTSGVSLTGFYHLQSVILFSFYYCRRVIIVILFFFVFLIFLALTVYVHVGVVSVCVEMDHAFVKHGLVCMCSYYAFILVLHLFYNFTNPRRTEKSNASCFFLSFPGT